MRLVRKIDEQGYFVEDVILQDGEFVEDNLIEVEVPQGFYRPKWDGEVWIEGMSSEEIAELKKPIIQEPSQEDYLLDLDYRVSLIELGL